MEFQTSCFQSETDLYIVPEFWSWLSSCNLPQILVPSFDFHVPSVNKAHMHVIKTPWEGLGRNIDVIVLMVVFRIVLFCKQKDVSTHI